MVVMEANAVTRDSLLATVKYMDWSSKVVLNIVVNGHHTRMETRMVD